VRRGQIYHRELSFEKLELQGWLYGSTFYAGSGLDSAIFAPSSYLRPPESGAIF
jgi:hypothetical protein